MPNQWAWNEVWDSRSTNLQSPIMGMNSKICTFQFINAITPIMPWLKIMEGVGRIDLYIPINLYPFQVMKEKP